LCIKKFCDVICCVIHAFIYAEPKLINKNQSENRCFLVVLAPC
jgi:hypothetical protein